MLVFSAFSICKVNASSKSFIGNASSYGEMPANIEPFLASISFPLLSIILPLRPIPIICYTSNGNTSPSLHPLLSDPGWPQRSSVGRKCLLIFRFLNRDGKHPHALCDHRHQIGHDLVVAAVSDLLMNCDPLRIILSLTDQIFQLLFDLFQFL